MRRPGRPSSRIAAAAAVVAVGLLGAGCWDSLDPKDLDVAVGLAFDKSPTGIAAIAEVPSAVSSRGAATVPSSSSSGSPVFLLAGEGPDVATALQRMAHTSGKTPYWGQLYSILFTTDLAREGLGPTVDTLIRMPELSNGTDAVLIEGRAMPFLAVAPKDVPISSLYTREHLTVLGRDLVFPIPLWSLYVTLHTPGLAPAVPVFRLITSAGGPTFEAVGMALFREDRLATILQGTDAQAFLVWTNHLGDATLSVPFDGQSVTLRRLKGRSFLGLAGWERGLPVFNLSVSLSGEVQKNAKGNLTFSPPELRRLEAQTSRLMAARLERVLREAQGANGDVFGLGAWLRYHNPEAFGSLQPWNLAFPRIRVVIKVRTRIFATGILS